MNGIHNRIILIRKHERINLSQEAFGKRLGVTGATVSRMEKGERKVTEQMKLAICREFNINRDFLENGNGDMFNPMSEDEELDLYIGRISGSDDNFKKNLLKALCKLTEDEWDVLKKIISEMEKE